MEEKRLQNSLRFWCEVLVILSNVQDFPKASRNIVLFGAFERILIILGVT